MRVLKAKDNVAKILIHLVFNKWNLNGIFLGT